ncbi:MAG: hypothetical protein ACYCWW_00540 [Deltaproteobacteria bacterium]
MKATRWLIWASLFLGGSASAIEAAGAQSLCGEVRAKEGATVIAFSPPSRFEICRDGEPQDDVVAGRPVYLELVPSAPRPPIAYRIPERPTSARPPGLRRWKRSAASLARALHALSHSGQPLSELASVGPGHDAAVRVQAVRASYRAVVTPAFHAALGEVSHRLSSLSELGDLLSSWCGRVAKEPDETGAEGPFLASCAAGHAGGARGLVERLRGESSTFEERRAQARALLLAFAQEPSEGNAAGAIDAVNQALGAATTLVSEAAAATATVEGIERDAGALGLAVESLDALRPGMPVFLARYGIGGNALLQLEARPATPPPPGEDGAGPPEADVGVVSYRFTVIDPSYFDVTAGLGYTAGLPPLPSLGAGNVIDKREVDQFVGLLLAELEPAKLLWPDRALASLLRFPVIGVPVTRDPTKNFFAGAGLGWDGVASIDFGPYLLREATLDGGYAFGQTAPANSSLVGITHPSLQVGYFVSANVDLVGLFHLLVHERPVTLDAATGHAEK